MLISQQKHIISQIILLIVLMLFSLAGLKIGNQLLDEHDFGGRLRAKP